MRRFSQKLRVLIIATVVFVLPQSVFAISYPKLLPDCATGIGNCNACDMLALFGNWSELLALGVIVPGVFVIAIGGLTWLISAGKPEKVQLGTKMIVGSVMGMVIVFLAYSIVNFSIAAMTGQTDLSKTVNVSGGTEVRLFNTEWSQICKSGEGASIVVTSCTAAKDGVSCSVGGECTGVACQCKANVCVNACQATAGRSCIAVSATCTGTVESTTAGALCEAGQVCCNGTAAPSGTPSAPGAPVVNSCAGQAVNTSCADAPGPGACTNAAICKCDATQTCVDPCEIAHASEGGVCFDSVANCVAGGGVQDAAPGLCSDSATSICCYEPPPTLVVTNCTNVPAGVACSAAPCGNAAFCECNAFQACVPACEVEHPAPATAFCVADVSACGVFSGTTDSSPGLCAASGDSLCCYVP